MALAQKTYDVVIVGARIAGSALASLLAKQNLSILLIDRQKVLGDVLSTHFINPRGLSYLEALGVGDKVRSVTPVGREIELRFDQFRFSGAVTEDALQKRLKHVHPTYSIPAITEYTSVRRKILDPILLSEAVTSGAEFAGGMTLVAIDDVGPNGLRKIHCIDAHGESHFIQTRILVGADGRKSSVASLLDIPKQEERFACTFASYTYFKDLHIGKARIFKRNRYAYAAVPTNDNLTMVLVFGPKDHFADYMHDREQNFFKTIESIDTDFANKVKKASRAEPFYSTVDQSAFIRGVAPQNTLLIGDAHSFKDQCTASGITHALRDAFLLAEHLKYGFEHVGAMDLSLQMFHEKRYLDSHKFYIYTCQQAEMNPIRPEEKLLFDVFQKDIALHAPLVEIFCDITSPSRLFGTETRRKYLQQADASTFQAGELDFQEKTFDNLYRDPSNALDRALDKNVADYALATGNTFEKRAQSYFEFYKSRQEQGYFQYARTLIQKPNTSTKLRDASGRLIDGINFASQDYLGLANHPRIKDAALAAIDSFGLHSAGSPMVIGNTLLTEQLEESLRKLTKKKHVLLFPTGYAAGIGSILGLVKPTDHIVMDRFSHACLQQGARAATKNIHAFTHLDHHSARALLRTIREKDSRNAILLVTEGIFSMDSDAPDLRAFAKVAKEFGATLFVDVAHDLGAMGPNGSGQLGIQKALSEVDLVMGSFSKTFATNGGFLATDSEAIVHYMKMFSSPHMFSNALSPVQTAIALEACRIVQSPEGAQLRNQLLDVVQHLRAEFADAGLTCLGEPSAIVPVLIGTEKSARIIHKRMMERNIATMILEYPVVPLGASRFRLQVMATHTIAQAQTVAREIIAAMADSRSNAIKIPQGGLESRNLRAVETVVSL